MSGRQRMKDTVRGAVEAARLPRWVGAGGLHRLRPPRWLALTGLALVLLASRPAGGAAAQGNHPLDPAAAQPAPAADSVADHNPPGTFYFHGTAADQANKNLVFTDPSFRGTATFDQNPPTEVVPDTQAPTPFANDDFVGNPLAAYWRGEFSGTVDGLLELNWFWSSPNAEATALGLALEVSVFADPEYIAARVQPQRLIGRARVQLSGVTPVPTEFTSTVPVKGTVQGELLIQVSPVFADTGEGALVHYDSTATPSRFRFVDAPPQPEVVFDRATTVEFAPATVVSAHFFGAEPQTTLERRTPRSIEGRLDPDRLFVDWPLTSRTQTSQLSRSTDGGDSFRLLLDFTCAARNRPNCLTFGGGDSENEVNLVNGNLFFADQELAVVNEGLASSTDHGDNFPSQRQTVLGNTGTATDRQWLGYADPSLISVGPRQVEAFLAYHVPAVGQHVIGIDQDGLPIAQPHPQIPLVLQSGPIRVDNSDGPGRGWVYQIYRGPEGVTVATAFGPDYQLPSAWESNVVSPDDAVIFPWLNHDARGNAYAVWVDSVGAQLYLSVSPIDDPRNDPQQGGRPGSFWTPQARVNLPELGSTVFPAVTAGDFGRIAITYMGSEDCVGPSDDCPAITQWNTYAAVITDAMALARGTPMTVVTGTVSHRVGHRGNICTGGAGCGAGQDRSLLDLIDLGFDESGRVGVVFMDNNNRLAAPNLTDAAKNGPFALFAKLTRGPSLLAATPDPEVAITENGRDDPAGDATWANNSSGTLLPALDLLGAEIFMSDDQVVVQVPLADSSVAGMQRDLAAYNDASALDLDAERLQYVVTFATGEDVFHLSMETLPDGSRRFFGGRLDQNDGVENGTGTVVAARYVTDDGIPVSGSLGAGTLTLRAPAAALGLELGSRLYSVTAFATAGPAEDNPTATVVANSSRTVDATPPFDAKLQEGEEPTTPVDCTDDRLVSFGGWHTLEDARAGEGTLCRHVGGGRGAFMELQFEGQAIEVFVARGPRGGSFDLILDGGAPMRVDLHRDPADPDHPDNSGRQDLDFGIAIRLDAGPGEHRLRIEVVNDDPDPRRNMVYVDGFLITDGEPLPPPSGGPADEDSLSTGALLEAAESVIELVVDETNTLITAVLEAPPEVSLVLLDPSGTVLASAEASDGTVAVRVTPSSPATYTIVVRNDGSLEAGFQLWTVLSEQ